MNQKLANNEYNIIGGIDEGGRLLVAANSYDPTRPHRPEFNTKYSSKTYQHESRQHSYKIKQMELTRAVLEKKESDRRIFQLTADVKDYSYLVDTALQARIAKQRERNLQQLRRKNVAGILSKRQKNVDGSSAKRHRRWKS